MSSKWEQWGWEGGLESVGWFSLAKILVDRCCECDSMFVLAEFSAIDPGIQSCHNTAISTVEYILYLGWENK